MNIEKTKKDKIKSLSYVVLFIFSHVFGGSLLSILNIPLVTDNLTFFVYIVLFGSALILFSSHLKASLKCISKDSIGTVLGIGFATFCGIVASGIFIDVIGITNSNEAEIDAALNSNFVLSAIVAIIFAPLAEELFFRFVLFNAFKKINNFLSHILVGILFGFFHIWIYVLIEHDYSQLINMPPYIIMSLGFSIVYKKTGNIIWSIIVHAAINIIAISV